MRTETFDEYADRTVYELRKKLNPWLPDYSALHPKPPEPPPPWSTWASEAVCVARRRARLKGWKFDLSSAWVRQKLAEQKYRCILSGVEFSERRAGESLKRPWRPSLDRIDAKKGYTRDNVRLVCVAVNTLLHDWGDGVFHAIIEATKK